MSNFGVTFLLKTYKNGNRLTIEDNIGEEIHIHFGDMRFQLKNNEFRDFSKNCLNYISDASGISLSVLEKLDPIFLFDLCRRGELESFKFIGDANEYIQLKDLYSPVRNKLGFWSYKRITHSHFLQVMKGKTQVTPYDKDQINIIGCNNVSRCQRAVDICRTNPNICEDYPLYVTKNNIIRDGQHRAAALLYLYGPRYKVRIQRIETNIYACPKRKIFQLTKVAYALLTSIYSYSRNLKGKIKTHKEDKVYRSIVQKPVNQESYLIMKNNDSIRNLVYFVDSDIALPKYPVIIKKIGVDYNDVLRSMNEAGYYVVNGHKNDGFSFIYGLKNDYLIYDKNRHPVAFLQEKLSANSMSVHCFMPLAPEIQQYVNLLGKIPECIIYTLRLLKCMFDKTEGTGFSRDDIEYFNTHTKVLDEEFFLSDGLFKKVFFEYSDILIKTLKEGNKTNYSSILHDFKTFEY